MNDTLIAVVLTVVPLTGGGLIAWGRIRSEVDDVRKDLDLKANKETVEVQYDAIMERLDRIEGKMDNRRRDD